VRCGQVVGDGEVHDHDGAAEDQVEVAGDPLRVVDGRIELVAHVDQPAGAAEAEQDERERHSEHDRILPRLGPGYVSEQFRKTRR
jgi:hypothetical protein